MGNGMVRDNIGSITDTPLDQWIATYGNYHEVRWGFGALIYVKENSYG